MITRGGGGLEKEERGGEVYRKDRKELGRVSGSIPHHGLKFGVGFGAVLWGAMGGGGGVFWSWGGDDSGARVCPWMFGPQRPHLWVKER